MTDVYGAAYTTIRAGAPGLSDATCEVIARSIARKLTGTGAPSEPEWQAEAFAFLYGLIGGAPATAANVIRKNPEVRARLHRAIYERRPREESYDAMMARLLPNGLPLEVEA